MPQRNIIIAKEYTNDDWNYHGIRVRWHDYITRNNKVAYFSFIGKSKTEIPLIRKEAQSFIEKQQIIVDTEWLNLYLSKFGETKLTQNRVSMSIGLPGVCVGVFFPEVNTCPSVYIKTRVKRKDKVVAISNCTRSTIIEKWKTALEEYCEDQELDFEWFWNKYSKEVKLTRTNLPNILKPLFVKAKKHLSVKIEIEDRLNTPKSVMQRGMRTGLNGLSVSYGYNSTKGDFDCQCQIREYANGETKAFSFSSYEHFKKQWPEIIKVYRKLRPNELLTRDDLIPPSKKEWDLMVSDGIDLYDHQLSAV